MISFFKNEKEKNELSYLVLKKINDVTMDEKKSVMKITHQLNDKPIIIHFKTLDEL